MGLVHYGYVPRVLVMVHVCCLCCYAGSADRSVLCYCVIGALDARWVTKSNVTESDAGVKPALDP
jgi:hypothetical protein